MARDVRGMDGLTRAERAARDGRAAGPAAPAVLPGAAGPGASQLERFRASYEATLAEQVRANPGRYSYGLDQVPDVARRMTNALVKGSADTNSPAIKAVAKSFGLAPKSKDIQAFLLADNPKLAAEVASLASGTKRVGDQAPKPVVQQAAPATSLDAFANSHSPVQSGKIKSALGVKFRAADGSIQTRAERIEKAAETGVGIKEYRNARSGKMERGFAFKRDGMELIIPESQIGKSGIAYAESLLRARASQSAPTSAPNAASDSSRAEAAFADARARGGRPVKVNVTALANDKAAAAGPRGSGAAYFADLDVMKAAAGPDKTAYLVEEGGRRYLQFADGTTLNDPSPGTYRDAGASKRYVTLGDGREVSLGQYTEAWKMAKSLPPDTRVRGSPTATFRDAPNTAGDAVREFRDGMHDRINKNLPAFGKGRKWSNDWQGQTRRMAAEVNNPRVRVQQVQPEYISRLGDRLDERIQRMAPKPGGDRSKANMAARRPGYVPGVGVPQQPGMTYKAPPTPTVADLPPGAFSGSQRDFERLSPGMRREIARSAERRAAAQSAASVPAGYEPAGERAGFKLYGQTRNPLTGRDLPEPIMMAVGPDGATHHFPRDPNPSGMTSNEKLAAFLAAKDGRGQAGDMPSASGERRYHLVAINDKTGRVEPLSVTPMTHDRAMNLKRAQGTPVKNVRHLIVEDGSPQAERFGFEAGKEAGNRSMRAGGRTAWNAADRAAATDAMLEVAYNDAPPKVADAVPHRGSLIPPKPAAMTVSVGGRSYPVESWKQVSEAFSKARDAMGEGASRTPGAVVRDASGKVVAHVSYNGKVWPGERWNSGDVPLYDPYAKGAPETAPAKAARAAGKSGGATIGDPALANAAAMDAGNRSMKAGGRTAWNADDRAASVDAWRKLMPDAVAMEQEWAAQRAAPAADSSSGNKLIGFQNESTQQAAQAGKAQKNRAAEAGARAGQPKGFPTEAGLKRKGYAVLEHVKPTQDSGGISQSMMQRVAVAHGIDETSARGRISAVRIAEDRWAVIDKTPKAGKTSAPVAMDPMHAASVVPRTPALADLKAEAKAAGVKGASKMNRASLMQALGKSLAAASSITVGAGVLGLIAADASRSQALAAGGDRKTANTKAAVAGATTTAVAAGTMFAIGKGIQGGMKFASRVAPRIAPALGPAGIALAAGGLAYGAYEGFRKTGTASGAAVGALSGGEVFHGTEKSGLAAAIKASRGAADPSPASDDGKRTYVKADGTTTTGTPEQIAAWQKQKK